MTGITTSQTIGPFPHESWRWAFDATGAARSGAKMTISGAVYDGAGRPIDDAVLEAWAPHATTFERDQLIAAFHRVPSGGNGEFCFALAGFTRGQGEPALYVTLFARGVLTHQFTAVFLEDDADPARSPILQQVPEARRSTLIARKLAPGQYQWNIWMQGDQETVFFDYE